MNMSNCQIQNVLPNLTSHRMHGRDFCTVCAAIFTYVGLTSMVGKSTMYAPCITNIHPSRRPKITAPWKTKGPLRNSVVDVVLKLKGMKFLGNWLAACLFEYDLKDITQMTLVFSGFDPQKGRSTPKTRGQLSSRYYIYLHICRCFPSNETPTKKKTAIF